MRSFHKTWSARSIAAVSALALLLASIIGAYGHASSHGHHSAMHALHTDVADVQGTLSEVAANPAHHGGHEHPNDGHDHAACLDIICHGWIAILADSSVFAAADGAAYLLKPAPTLHSAAPGCLDRPPRPSVLA